MSDRGPLPILALAVTLTTCVLPAATAQPREPASVDVEPDSPLQRDVLRLSLRYGELSPGISTRPTTRLEAARLLDHIQRRYGDPVDAVDRGLRRRLAAELGPELAWIRGGRRYGQVLFRPLAEIRCEAMIATGGDPYPLHAGDAAGPFGGCSLTAELVAGPLAVVLEPRVAYDPVGGGNAPAGPIALGGSAVLDMPRGYAKLAGANLELAGGVGGLAWSTGRSGLIWSGNAADPLMVRFTQPRLWQLPWIFRYLGDFRATLLWAHLLGPREDVDRPYTLGMKIDWRPVVPWLEISLSRLAMYGGEGRPDATAVDIWQLIWATHPHADYDEDKNLFDANEIAAIEATLQVPFAHLIPGVRFLQLYWTNAGEDTIRTYLGPLPLPGLTGAANLGGFYLGVVHPPPDLPPGICPPRPDHRPPHRRRRRGDLRGAGAGRGRIDRGLDLAHPVSPRGRGRRPRRRRLHPRRRPDPHERRSPAPGRPGRRPPPAPASPAGATAFPAGASPERRLRPGGDGTPSPVLGRGPGSLLLM